ncbi:MAG: DUF1559 domain-containing protein [Planctomycetales bacterium]|nr:DUF1559 domain-containing protein [Planctomycetales bacterium]
MPNKKSAFTIVELLVVIAIIGILVALLLPAIGAARDRARATENQSNLRSIGQALQAYYAVKQYYTPLIKYYAPPRELSKMPASELNLTTSWAFELLPYLDQQSVYDSRSIFAASWHESNSTAFGTPIPTFANPRFRDASTSCPISKDGEHDDTFLWFGGASIDYAANGGVIYTRSREGRPFSGHFRFNQKLSGPFHWSLLNPKKKIDSSDVVDGEAHTIAVGDRWTPRSKIAKAYFDECGFAGASTNSIVRFADGWTEIDAINGAPTKQVFPRGHDDDNDLAYYKFGSPAAKGDNCCFVFLDGHTKWIDYDIDFATYRAILTIADGGTPGDY